MRRVLETVSSKTPVRFQSGIARRLLTIAATVAFGVVASGSATMPNGRPTPTGLEVPRWVTLKSSQVRARQGPGLDYRILWEYRAAGLPVQVIAETREWRKICDAEGSVAWIHRSVASGRRSVFNTGAVEMAIRSGRSDTAPVRARLSPRSLVGMEACHDGWCEVRARKLHGWVRQGTVFGTQTRALCNAARPAGSGRSGR